MKLDTWIIDCVVYDCKGHMELQELTQTDFSIEADGPVEHSFQAWCCDTCDEWIGDIERESRELVAYKIS